MHITGITNHDNLQYKKLVLFIFQNHQSINLLKLIFTNNIIYRFIFKYFKSYRWRFYIRYICIDVLGSSQQYPNNTIIIKNYDNYFMFVIEYNFIFISELEVAKLQIENLHQLCWKRKFVLGFS